MTKDAADPQRQTAISPSAAVSGHPPRLDTRFWRQLKVLLLLNILPIAALTWVGIAWWQKKIEFTTQFSSKQWLTLGVILASCGVMALAAWVILPLARWLRDYPLWHYRQSRAAWLLPMVGGQCLWALLFALGFAAIGGASAVIATGIYYLWNGR